MALHRFLDAAVRNKPLTFLELAGDAVGCVQNGPRDLSYNPRYMKGFGK